MEKRGAKYHRGRLGEALREEIETIVEGELGDPRIGLASVTSVELAEDSRSARILMAVHGNEEECQRTLEGLTAAVGFIRHEVADRVERRAQPLPPLLLDHDADRRQHVHPEPQCARFVRQRRQISVHNDWRTLAPRRGRAVRFLRIPG